MRWPRSGKPWPIRCSGPTRRSGCTSTVRTSSWTGKTGPGCWFDLGAGLLEEADPKDVVAELLPDVPPDAQAELVAGLWRVRHPGVTDLLTALSDHHPDPGVARAARKAAFKARSVSAS